MANTSFASESSRTIRTPKYRRQKEPNGYVRAFVEVDGKRIKLGQYGSPGSKERYRQIIAAWHANNGRLPDATESHQITVVEVVAKFWEHAKQHYRLRDGTPTTEIANLHQALKPLLDLYGSTKAVDFGPLALHTLRKHLISNGWARTNINRNVARIKHVFKWAASHELIPAAVSHALSTIEGLKEGRCEARETERVEPATQEQIDGVRPFVSRQVAALIDIQLLTGARPGELLKLRTLDLDRSGSVWTFQPEHHKTAHRGQKRIIFFGPKAQAVLNPFISNRPEDAYLFSPREAERDRHDKAEKHRRPNQKPNPKLSDRELGGHYTRDSYRRAIARACDAAFPHPILSQIEPEKLTPEQRKELRQWKKEHRWHPHQLRHTAATNLRREFGIDVAQTVLGHKMGSSITELYAEADLIAAKGAILKVG